MNKRTIYITKHDYDRLTKLINDNYEFNIRNQDNFKELASELQKSIIINDSKAIPPDVITMNTKFVLLDIDTKEKRTFILVFPKDSNSEEGKISILAPIGVAVLGYSVGDEIEWQVPAGERRIKIVDILYQPEASGNYDL